MYVPGVDTVIDAEVSPLLHNNVPVNDPAVNMELVQLSTTDIVGGSTAAFIGAAVPFPWALIHPFTVCATEYVPAVVTVIDAVVAPVLQDKLVPVAVNTELPQLLTTVTPGGGGFVLGFAVPLPAALVDPLTV